MFPYKSNAFHAYETNRNPLKSRYLAYLLAITALLGVLVFTEARAFAADNPLPDVNNNHYFADNTYDCDTIELALRAWLFKIADAEDSMARAKQMNDTIRKRATQIPAFLTEASKWATIYNAVCK